MAREPEYHQFALDLAKGRVEPDAGPPAGAFPSAMCTVCERCEEYVATHQAAKGAVGTLPAMRVRKTLERLRATVDLYDRYGVECAPPREKLKEELERAKLLSWLTD